MKTAEEFAQDLRDHLKVLDTERARVVLALDSLDPRRANAAKARAAKAAKAKTR